MVIGVVGCSEAKVSNEPTQREASAASTNDITTILSERDRNKDGKPDSRTEQFFRDGQRVMVVLSKVNAQGDWVVGSRSYCVGGKAVLIEGDDDGDGLFETLIVYRTDTDDFEVFTRDVSGLVLPANKRVLEAHKKQSRAFAEFFDEMQASTNLDDHTIEERFRSTQKKFHDAAKEITDENK